MGVLKHALAQARVDINWADGEGVTALHRAAEGGRIQAIDTLIKHGANVNLSSIDGVTPLHAAAIDGHTQAAFMLIDAGAHVNQPDKKHGATPLHYAASCGHTQVIDVLVKAGANVHAVTNDGETPQDIARQRKQLKAAQLLETLGAKR